MDQGEGESSVTESDIPDVYDDEGNLIDKSLLYRQTDEFLDTLAEIRKLQPMRIGVMKRYWDKFKYNKKRREHMIELFDSADEQVAFYMGDEYVDWRDSIPGTRQFL